MLKSGIVFNSLKYRSVTAYEELIPSSFWYAAGLGFEPLEITAALLRVTFACLRCSVGGLPCSLRN